MDLVGVIAEACNVDRNLASKVLGAIFTSIRMGVDTKSFAQVVSAFPGCSDWMREAPTSSARTGALLALATPATLERGLRQLGLGDEQIAASGKLVGAALKAALPAGVTAKIVGKLPLLRT